MAFLETVDLKAYQRLFALIVQVAEKEAISKEDASILLAGNAVQIVAFMKGEAFTREMCEAALLQGVQSRQEAA